MRAVQAVQLAAMCCALGLPLAGCGGPERSVQSYCSYFYGEGTALHDKWEAESHHNTDLMGQLTTVFGAPRQLATFFHGLDERAPDEIEPDVATMADAFDKVADQMGDGNTATNPLGGLASSLMLGLSTAGASKRVNDWTDANCGPPPKAG